jgi:uncharacterized protein YjiS (DUF1127 family)
MRTSTTVGSLTAPEQGTLGGVTHSDTPVFILLRGGARNDATSGDPATLPDDEIELAAQYATDGVGGMAAIGTAASAQLPKYELHRAARAHRSLMLGGIVIAAIRAAVAIARRAHARHRKRREAWAVQDALRELDDRTLRDLGFDRSEIRSVSAEMTGEAEHTRMLTLWTSHGPAG